MRKKCVRWTKSVRTALIATAAIISAMAVNPAAQTSDPSAQPKLAFSDISYLGGFRLPASAANGDDFAFGGKQLTFNPASNSLFVGSRGGRIAEVSIPNPVNSSNPSAMPFASYLQPFSDPTEGQLSQITGEGVRLDSLMVFGNRLYGTASVYYDANGTQQVSHYSRSLQLNEPSFSGWSSVWAADKTGFVSGAMSVVPSEWRGALGGPAATGQCCIPIVMRTSWGPSAFAFDPAKIGESLVSASPLLYYTGTHPTLGNWDDSNPTYGATIQMGGMAMIAGTRTVLYFGRNGMGPNCYGNGTADQSLVGTLADDGAHYCYDPTSNDKGSHAYPYRYQIWAYDLNDFAAVKAGTKQPWEVTPYGVWPFDFPTAEESVKIGGVGYDPATQRLYVSQLLADRDGYSYRPVIHVLQINATPGSTDPSDAQPLSSSTTTTTTTTTTTSAATTTESTVAAPISSVVSAITMSVNRTAPQVTGTAITFSAFATGGVSPQEYKWLLDDGTGMKMVQDWSVSETFTWTPATANANYRVSVWARSHGSSVDAPEASASSRFPITAPPAGPLRSVRITSDKPAPQPQGTAIALTATTDGGSALEYKWLLHDGLAWAAVTGWSAQNTFTWTPAVANSQLRVGVWVRSNNSVADVAEVTASEDFPIAAKTSSAATLTAPSAVNPGSPVQTVLTNGPGEATDWVGLFAVGADKAQFSQWQFLNGLATMPATGITSATLQFIAPTAPGDYELRLYGKGYALRAVTATIKVAATTSTAAPAPTGLLTTTTSVVPRGGVVEVVLADSAATATDWVGLYAVGTSDSAFLEWQYLNGLETVPVSAVSSGTLRFKAPMAAGNYEVRMYGRGYVRLATTAVIKVTQ